MNKMNAAFGVVPGRRPFPHTQEELVNDERCAWSNESKTWILEDHTTETEWEWNPTVLKWSQLVSVLLCTFQGHH